MQNNDQRKDLKKDSLIVIVLVLICAVVLVTTDFGKNRTVIYDCRDAHWHPDVPLEVKKECRELMKKELEKQRNEDPKPRVLTT